MTKIPFKISARTAGLIGKENIATTEGAIIELVKNTYDADAKTCIIFFDFRNKKDRCLYIIDNGEGMNDKIIEEHWMTIGTSNKLHSPYSKLKRIKSGAKGIGRFALDRLGKSVTMFTKPKGNKIGFEWKANWEEFNEHKTLEKVFADLEEKQNLSIENELKTISENFNPLKKILKDYNFSQGTIFKISGLHDEWDEEGLVKLFKNLEAIVPPQPNTDFNLFLLCTSFENKFGKIESLFWDDYDYKLIANVKKNGSINIELDRREFNWKAISQAVFKEKTPMDMSKKPYDLNTLKRGSFSFTTSINELMPGSSENVSKEIIESIGAFDFHFYFLKRAAKLDDAKIYSYRNFDSNLRKEWLERFGGIKLFRDNFRVRPFGELNSTSWDWLELGNRAAGMTMGSGQREGIGWKVGPNQIYGYINISRINNPELKDTTNREGLLDNKTFHTFRYLLIRLINIVEKDRHYISRPMRAVYEKENEIAEAKEKAKQQAEEDLERESKRKSKSKSHSAKNTYAKATKGFVEEIQQKNDEIKMLRALASLGMTISTFTHELGDISKNLDLFSKELGKLLKIEISSKKFEHEKSFLKNPFLLSTKISDLILRMNNWINFANKTIKKDRRKAADLVVSKYFNDLNERWFEMLEATKVQLIIDKNIGNGKITNAYPIDLDSIFHNLILNSIDAFLRKDSTAKREIHISSREEKKGISIIYEDTGPGLHSDIKKPEEIFQAFVTTKKRAGEDIGIGLGMWILKTTIEQYNGYVEILKEKPGFKLKIYFPKYSK